MKKLISFTLMLMILFVSTSCNNSKYKYTSDSPYVYENYTSGAENQTYLVSKAGWMINVFSYTQSLSIYMEGLKSHQEALGVEFDYVLLLVERKHSESHLWYEERQDENYPDSKYEPYAYTLTELKVLECLEGVGNVVSSVSEKETITLLEPYAVSPEGDLVYNWLEVNGDAYAKDAFHSYIGCATPIIDSDEPYILMLCSYTMLEKGDRLCMPHCAAAPDYDLSEYEGAFTSTFVLRFNEEAYAEARAILDADTEKQGSGYITSGRYAKNLYLSYTIELWEKFHATTTEP